MITREKLEKYKGLKRELELLEFELRDMRNGSGGREGDTVKDYRKGYPVTVTIEGLNERRYRELLQKAEKKREKIKEIESWIDGIEEERTHIVFEWYYVRGLSWRNIARRLGKGVSEDYPRIVIRDRYLKEKGIK